MSQFARDGYRVIYVDTLGLRSPKLKDFRRIFSRLRNRLGARAGGIRSTEEGVHVYSPLILPFLDSQLSRHINVELIVSALQRIIGKLGCENPILWVYLPTWTILQCAKRIPHRMLVYNCTNALSSNPHGISRDYEISELEILRKADLVLTTAESLLQEKKPHNPNTHWVPFGVETEFFDEVELASELEFITKPRIGFFGAIDHRLDLELVQALAQAHRNWSFVLIGAARCDISILLTEENIHFLGSKPHKELPGYLSGLDVLYLPYVVDEFTRHVHPAKIYECLASGKPVVATALPAMEAFSGVVKLVAGLDEFDRALQEAVAENRADLQQQRVELARANSWEVRFQKIRGLVEEKEG